MRRLPAMLLLGGLVWAAPLPSPADELSLSARKLAETAIVRDLHLANDGLSLELDQGELIEDDGPAAGFSYKPNEEKLSPGVRIKKELILGNPQAKTARLLVGPGGNLEAIINGTAQKLERQGKAGQYWDVYSLDPQLLKAGKNEIVLHGSGKVWIARDDEFALGDRIRNRHPNRSAKSTDGGKTWNDDRLGAGGDIDGEYCVRLFLERHHLYGIVVLPVIDLGNLAGKPVAPPLTSVGPVKIAVVADTPAGCKVSLCARTAPTCLVSDPNWSAWQSLDAKGVLEKPAGRFLQVMVDLSTTDRLQTPRLKELRIEVNPQRPDDWTAKLKVLVARNEVIVRTSIPFQYEPFDHPHLKKLRDQYRLDEVVKEAKSEYELITRLASWSAKQWDHGHLKEIYPAWDALAILKPHTDGKPVGGFCQQYNLVFLQACESFGLVGRAVSIGTGDHHKVAGGGHEVVEIWSNDHKKWVYVDGNTAWHAVNQATEVPLSLWELRQRQLAALGGKRPEGMRIDKLADTKYTWKGLDSWPPFLELRLIPRSNFLAEKAPLPLNQGMRGWFWTGHHVWTDAASPASLLYGNRVAHRPNWDWTLNQAHYFIAATGKPGEIQVHLDTETPGFATFLADLDGAGNRPVESGFLWKLHAGKNRLAVRPRNSAGREGIASTIVLDHP